MNVIELFRLDGKAALVTGGTGLYGSHISRALAEAGAKVIIASRNFEACESYASSLREEGLDTVGMRLDLTCEDSIISLRDDIISRFGGIDILCNNAVARAGQDLDTTTSLQWETAMKVNSTGFFLSCKIFGEDMAQRRKGSIINIASIYGVVGPDFSLYGHTGMTNSAEYAFSKGGMINFTRYLATYFGGSNIRVNSISPGGYYTGQPEEFVENYNKRTPLGRMAGDDDIKGAVVFLASDASSYITGHNLMVDGGWTAW